MTFATSATSKGLRIHYEATGYGPALLLLNGWTASGRMWPRAWLAGLTERYRLLAVDNRGTGGSGAVEAPCTIADLAADAVSVLDHAGVEQAHVVGVSMGGMIAQELALGAPGRVRGLVLVATSPPAPERVDTPPEVLMPVLARRAEAPSIEEWLRELWLSLAAPGFADRHPELVDELMGQVLGARTPMATTVQQLQAILLRDRAERLAAIAAPTLVVHGDVDPLIPVENGRRLARLIPGARYVELPGVGHLVPVEAGGPLLAAVTDFLAGV